MHAKFPRKFLNKSDEKIAIQEFVKDKGYSGSVITYPDPPDCIIELANGQVVWIEVSIVYRDDSLARSLNSLQEGERAFTFNGSPYEYISSLIQKISKRIKDKDSKSNYKTITAKHGKGILILYVDDPFASFEILQSLKVNSPSMRELLNFNSVYLWSRPHCRGTIGKLHYYPSSFYSIIES